MTLETGSVIGTAATPSVSLWLLLAMTMVMSLLSGVGALPYLFTGKLEPYWSGIANAVGCGVMLAASFDLLEESKAYSAPLVLGGILLGVLAMAYSQSWLSRFENAILIIGVMAAHAFGEGSGVGVSFSGPRGWAQGLLVTIAIGLHNIPEGMAVATIMVDRGAPPRTALFWTLLSALPQGIVAVPAYMFVETFSGLLPIALGFAAGCMIWIVFAELIPDALETAEHGHVATAATLSAAALQCISMVIAKLERPDGSLASPIAADVSVLLPDLLLLLPGFLTPCVAAGLAGSLLPSLPLTMGLSVGGGISAAQASLAASRSLGGMGTGLDRRNGYGASVGFAGASHLEDGGVGAVTITWNGPLDLQPATDRPRECVRAALVVGVMLLAGTLPLAYEVAAVLLHHLGDASTLLPPLMLRGIAPGVTCVGIVRTVAGAPGWRRPAAAAGLLATCLGTAVSLVLLSLPYGRVAAEEIALDPAGLAGRLQAFASGGLLLAAVGQLWPAAAHFKPRKVQLGVSLGLGLGAFMALLHAGLCAGTPYCLALGTVPTTSDPR
ncbi:ZIP family transporter [Volvox carteri f. nagariensis]|uniref:ZIP family transporter n=1 Tax=Volvox carteri f. nagariensis TaxID=3068 RepID=D8UIU6_VOLCA|nr:ZIP family transporter [Volvox carteri f. nagariensis]EFJ40336.1 ZIP family transporter [Volvox carteri f. nagariensis]|eukprot:XP_002958599.1 ZIP family transporter [Volvox carteri f. nagariensis]